MKKPAGIDFDAIGLAVLGQHDIAAQEQVIQGIADLRPVGPGDFIEDGDVGRDELRLMGLDQIIQQMVPDDITRFHS